MYVTKNRNGYQAGEVYEAVLEEVVVEETENGHQYSMGYFKTDLGQLRQPVSFGALGYALDYYEINVGDSIKLLAYDSRPYINFMVVK